MKTLKFETKSKSVLEHPAINSVLIYDIETDSLDKSNAKCKFFGCYSYKHKKYFMFNENEKEAIQHLIDEHKVLVGFNNREFDGPIMQNITNRFDLNYKIVFDCLTVLYDYKRRRSNRETMIFVDGKSLQELLPNRKLKTVCEVLKFPITKGDIDYNVFKKSEWTDIELKDIYKYLYKDVNLTRMLFEFYVEYFEPYKEYVDEKNINKFDYIRSSGGSYAYSAICHLSGLEPEFETDTTKLLQKPENHGGFVLKPQVEYIEGTIIYSDFASLYPHLMAMCNLFSPIDDKHSGNIWMGGEMFKEIQTPYDICQLGKIEKIVVMLINKKQEFKKSKDPREKPVKLFLNTLYGISGSPIFKNIFNMTTSGDTTYIGRTAINYTRERFEKEGFKVIYGDTDSLFIVLPKDKTIDDYKELANTIVYEILKEVPFPVDTFKLDIDDIFKKLWLFGKKNYVGINEKGKLIVKGIPIKKSNASQLGQKIFGVLKSLILEQNTIKFPKEFIDKMINDEIDKDITIIGQVYNVKSPDNYKSTTSIQFQIAKHLGEGSHILIPNKTLGEIGKTKHYCSPEEAKTLTFDELFLDKVYKELEPFIK